jgi:predicted 2-oxoglutarate/Fe(II)-dependent dioxygenase YbiX
LTAHRRFALSVNLTADFDGGEVSFPEYNGRGIKAPPGWCVVFPAAILHMVTRVTRGKRYAFLPFVYDEEGANIRAAALARHAASGPQEAANA